MYAIFILFKLYGVCDVGGLNTAILIYLILNKKNNKKKYINASSNIINNSMIYSYDKTIRRNYDTKSYILTVSHVDSRDGLPKSIKEADIIMVTDPD